MSPEKVGMEPDPPCSSYFCRRKAAISSLNNTTLASVAGAGAAMITVAAAGVAIGTVLAGARGPPGRGGVVTLYGGVVIGEIDLCVLLVRI